MKDTASATLTYIWIIKGIYITLKCNVKFCINTKDIFQVTPY